MYTCQRHQTFRKNNHSDRSASLMEQGIDVYSLDIAPTPMAFREARKYQAGLIVTASHNPLEWNGLKFITEGRGIFENELDMLAKGNPSTSTSLGEVL